MTMYPLRLSMRQGVSLCATALCLLVPHARAGISTVTFDLLTDDEMRTWNSPGAPTWSPRGDLVPENGLPTCHSKVVAAANAPQIDVLEPSLGKPLSAPIDINVVFIPDGNVPILPTSFRVCYVSSFITVDITKRITDHATVSTRGLQVAGANLPAGHHHLVLLISDDQGRTGRREAIFDIQ